MSSVSWGRKAVCLLVNSSEFESSKPVLTLDSVWTLELRSSQLDGITLQHSHFSSIVSLRSTLRLQELIP